MCPMRTADFPYYVGGVITDPGELTLQTPESFYSRFHIDVRVHHEVTAIHPERRNRICVQSGNQTDLGGKL